MNTKKLAYTVDKNQYITNWLTSDIIQTPFMAKMVPTIFENYHPGASVKKLNGKERTSPAKDEFLKKAVFENSNFPSKIVTENLYWPFDTQRVDFSGFWHYPQDITFYAKAYFNCDADIDQSVEICTCGAIKIWVNNDLSAQFYPYEANIEVKKQVVLKLKKGKNEILVGCNNYGERNIIFNYGIKNMGLPLNVELPINADIQKMQSINKSLQAMFLDKLSYTQGQITVCTDMEFEYNCSIQVELCNKKLVLNVSKGDKVVNLYEVKSLSIGYHEITIRCVINKVVLSMILWAEVYPEQLSTTTPKALVQRKELALSFISTKTDKSYEQYIAHLYFGENKAEEYKDIINAMFNHVQLRGDCSDFRVAKMLWVLIKFKNLLTKEQIEEYEQAILNFRFWFDEKGNDAMWFFSENHALCFHTSLMIAGELFANHIFTNSGLTGLQQSQKAKKLIIEWFEKLLSYGYNEWNSIAYIPVDMLSYITLLEHCKDEKIKQLARQALDYTFNIFAQNSFKGLLATSNGRTYPRDLLANKNLGTNPLLWLAFGEGCLNAHTDPLIFLALSSYTPPQELINVACYAKAEKLVINNIQGTFNVPTMLCKTKDYILGTCVTPRTGEIGSQEHLLNIFIKDYKSRIWINHPGEGKIFGVKRPGYFTGNGLTPLVSQHKNIAVMSYHFDVKLLNSAEVDFTHAFCDMDVCDETILKDNWAFIRREDAFVAIYSKKPIFINQKAPLKNKEIIAKGINNTWLVKVAAIPEFDSFEKFVSWHLQNNPTETDKVLSFNDFEFGSLTFSLM